MKTRKSAPKKLAQRHPMPRKKRAPYAGPKRANQQKKRKAEQPKHRPVEPSLMEPPPKLSAEEEKLWDHFDLTGLEYLRMARLRKKTALTPAQRDSLHKHDALERRMAYEPEAVLREAHQAVDLGTSMLCKLIRGAQLCERGLAGDEKTEPELDRALLCLISRAHHLNSQLLRLAGTRRSSACRFLFSEAKRFAEHFIRLAQAHPEDFIGSAEGSLTMPSLRTIDPGYSADAEAIASKINLGQKHPAAAVHDQRDRFGSLCHILVAHMLDSIHLARSEFESHQQTAAHMQVSVSDCIRSFHYPDSYEHIMACVRLPDWKENAPSWWKMRVLPMVKEEFQNMVRDPLRNPALWQELQIRGETHRTTHHDMRRSLEKNCKNKFDQFARTAHKTSAHGQAD